MKQYIPSDIVNYICEFAAGRDKLWYPFFSPNTGRVSWKVNPYCQTHISLSKKLLNSVHKALLTFYNVNTDEEEQKYCDLVVFRRDEAYIHKLYIQFDYDIHHIESNQNQFIIRGMLNYYNHNIKTLNMLYLNNTPYATVDSGWSNINHMYNPTRITLLYETY